MREYERLQNQLGEFELATDEDAVAYDTLFNEKLEATFPEIAAGIITADELIASLGQQLKLRDTYDTDRKTTEWNEVTKQQYKDKLNEYYGLDYPAFKRVYRKFISKAVLDDSILKTALQLTQASELARPILFGKLEKTIIAKNTTSKELDKISETTPVIYKAAQLESYRNDLTKSGHIAMVPSSRTIINQIGEKMLSGRPMFLHGPTGTGKTSLARYAAEEFTGQEAEMIYCSPQTRESQIWGKTGIEPTESGAFRTVEIAGPLTKAIQEGKAVIFDEFTALPSEQMVFIKGLLNARPGDTINIPGNGNVVIQPGFQIILTANLKSEKNPERQELPPEIAREFEQNNLKIDYTPGEEAYDIALSRLMNEHGQIKMSKYDLTVTIPKLLEAFTDIQTAYIGTMTDEVAQLTGTVDVGSNKPSLQYLVFTQGTIANILEGWQQKQLLGEDAKGEDKNLSFVEYLDDRLQVALNFETYPLSDRELAAKILAIKGLLTTKTEQELHLSDGVLSGLTITDEKNKEEKIAASRMTEIFNIGQIAAFDPMGARDKKASEDTKEFVSDTATGTESPEAATTIAELESWLETISWLNKANLRHDSVSPRATDHAALAANLDTTEFGEYTTNPDIDSIPLSEQFKKLQVLSNDDIKQKMGKTSAKVHEIMDWLKNQRYQLPDFRLEQYIIEKINTLDQNLVTKFGLQDGNWYHFPGSVVCASDGYWFVPFARGAWF